MLKFRFILVGISCLATARVASATNRSHARSEDTTSIVEVTGKRCPKIAEEGTFRCFEHRYGLVFAKDTVGLEDVIDNLLLSANNFKEYFDTLPGRGALVLTDAKTDSIKKFRSGVQGNLELSPKTSKMLFGLGYHWVLAFPPRESFKGMLAKQLAQQFPDPSIVEGAVEGMMSMYDGLLSHELGHAWYISGYWPSEYPESVLHPDIVSQKQYAGPAPDWLDEAAAVLLEDTTLKAQRRSLVHSTLQNNPDDPAFLSLDTLFVMRHPFSGKGNVAKVDMFYAETRVLIDFLLLHSKPDRPIFNSITQAVLNGKTTAQWLRESGSQYGLPTTVAELNTQWRAWIAKEQ